MSFISLPTDKLRKKTKAKKLKISLQDTQEDFIETSLKILIAWLVQNFLVAQQLIQIYQQKRFKNIFQLLAILEKGCKMTSIYSLRVIDLTMRVLGKSQFRQKKIFFEDKTPWNLYLRTFQLFMHFDSTFSCQHFDKKRPKHS